MTNSERAAQFWSVLVMATRTQQLLSYTMVEGMTRIPRQAQGRPLGDIFFYCKQNGLPSLTSIVLEQKTGRPAAPEFDPPFDLDGEHRRVFIFDWLKHGCPKVEEFQEARDKEEAAVTV
jgi:hypothetical protein